MTRRRLLPVSRSGGQENTSNRVKDGLDVHGFVLNAFPRWDKETILRVRPYRGTVVTGEFVLTNPAPGTFAQWTPKPLPDTGSDGDLEVTLTKLVAGATTPSWRGGSLMPTNDPVNQCVHLNFDFRQNGQSTTNWDPWPVQTTDAAGNWSRGLIYAYPTNGVRQIWGRMMNGANIPPPEHYGMDGYYFQPGLWPNQPWKVRLEFIQGSGFSDDEMVTFTNVPVKPGSQQDFEDEWTAWDFDKTNFPFTITPATVNGVHLKLLPPLLITNRWQSSEMDASIIIGADPGFNPKGMNLTVVAATDDQGRELWSFETPAWAGHYSIEFARVHDDVKSLNLKLALHKSRFVEFTVKPAQGVNMLGGSLRHKESSGGILVALRLRAVLLCVKNHFLISALFPCAPRPSSSANFFTDFSAFFSEARLYSTTLVRRWN